VVGVLVDLTVHCPPGYESPTRPVSVRLERFSDRTRIPEYTVSCPAATRKVVVAIRAENGPNLPVVCMNRVVAQTDASGAAHFAVEVSPGAQFEVRLDTQQRADLVPQNPTRSFGAPPEDAIVLFDQRFDAAPRPRP
jgi:hypothetical protein